ncbi:MAG: hypothetical protein KAI80_00560, partial [Hyphomicrobiaceae bacterium]|nr:hypothetical protein [Hyphomicrobiaceae bacterium]
SMLRNKGTRWSLHTLGSAIRHAEITIIIIWFSPVSGAHKRKIGHRYVVAVLAGRRATALGVRSRKRFCYRICSGLDR